MMESKNKPMTASEWLKAKKPLGGMITIQDMTEYSGYVQSFVPPDIEKAIEGEYPDYSDKENYEQEDTFTGNQIRVLQRTAARFGYYLSSAQGWIDVKSSIELANFWSKCRWSDYCWEWGGSTNNDGYGTCRWRGKSASAHRVAYQLVYGVIDAGVHVLHRCDNPKCINPQHLFLGDHKVNMEDKRNKGRGRTKGRSSKYLGVGFRTDNSKWRAYYIVDGKIKNIGCYDTELRAAECRDRKILEMGIDAKLNFPQPPITHQ